MGSQLSEIPPPDSNIPPPDSDGFYHIDPIPPEMNQGHRYWPFKLSKRQHILNEIALVWNALTFFLLVFKFWISRRIPWSASKILMVCILWPDFLAVTNNLWFREIPAAVLGYYIGGFYACQVQGFIGGFWGCYSQGAVLTFTLDRYSAIVLQKSFTMEEAKKQGITMIFSSGIMAGLQMAFQSWAGVTPMGTWCTPSWSTGDWHGAVFSSIGVFAIAATALGIFYMYWRIYAEYTRASRNVVNMIQTNLMSEEHDIHRLKGLSATDVMESGTSASVATAQLQSGSEKVHLRGTPWSNDRSTALVPSAVTSESESEFLSESEHGGGEAAKIAQCGSTKGKARIAFPEESKTGQLKTESGHEITEQKRKHASPVGKDARPPERAARKALFKFKISDVSPFAHDASSRLTQLPTVLASRTSPISPSPSGLTSPSGSSSGHRSALLKSQSASLPFSPSVSGIRASTHGITSKTSIGTNKSGHGKARMRASAQRNAFRIAAQASIIVLSYYLCMLPTFVLIWQNLVTWRPVALWLDIAAHFGCIAYCFLNPLLFMSLNAQCRAAVREEIEAWREWLGGAT
ncbi:uncharacterized protein EV422DRAFT_564721 [Fimicolochytrium jonesii]|uniref:uncharacterized protein n=1 Tax=Fimicolochytrium jonesii TaxID=1396493 RepID=UPI0022FE2BAE|nr:uncharacterized protein EV422DRAFT_564721 [Fimicolochytrium jonesii]KAI8824014.1 hypothetical protein EV422DRAFT_564721 [Fimicolochytrium jonesii]